MSSGPGALGVSANFSGMEYQTILLDPQSISATRFVFRIEPGRPFFAKRLRICNFGLSNAVGNSTEVYYNHAGIYSIISKVSINNLSGTEIDHLSGNGIDGMMGIRLLQMPNSAEFSINRQLSQQMCNSIFCPTFSQTTLTEKRTADDSVRMGNSIYIDLASMLTYLQARTVIDEGLTIIVELKDPSVLGYDYSFTRPPALAVDFCLDPMLKADVGPEFGFSTIVDDRILMQSSPSFERRLQSFYNMYIRNFYYYNQGRSNNTLRLPLSRPNEKVELTINGLKVLPLKGIDSDAKKMAFLNDFAGKSSITHYSSYVDGINAVEGLFNPNLSLKYSQLNTSNGSTPTGGALGAVFSYGCIRLDQPIGADITLSYGSDMTQGTNGVTDGDTLVFLAETMRAYNKQTGLVRFVGQM
jgi:hypothetical protein